MYRGRHGGEGMDVNHSVRVATPEHWGHAFQQSKMLWSPFWDETWYAPWKPAASGCSCCVTVGVGATVAGGFRPLWQQTDMIGPFKGWQMRQVCWLKASETWRPIVLSSIKSFTSCQQTVRLGPMDLHALRCCFFTSFSIKAVTHPSMNTQTVRSLEVWPSLVTFQVHETKTSLPLEKP